MSYRLQRLLASLVSDFLARSWAEVLPKHLTISLAGDPICRSALQAARSASLARSGLEGSFRATPLPEVLDGGKRHRAPGGADPHAGAGLRFPSRRPGAAMVPPAGPRLPRAGEHPFVDLLPEFLRHADQSPRRFLDPRKDLYWSLDGHWSPKGNRLAGLTVARHLVERRLIALPDETERLRAIPASPRILLRQCIAPHPRPSPWYAFCSKVPGFTKFSSRKAWKSNGSWQHIGIPYSLS